MNYTAATQPTFYFIGVTTTKSSIMKVFPAWAKHLGVDAVMKGIDLPLNDDRENYRRVVAFLKGDPLSLGGLVTQATAIDFPDKVQLAIPMGTAAYIDGFTRDWMQAEIDLRKQGVTLPDYFLAPHYAAYAFPAKALHDPELMQAAGLAARNRALME